MKRITITLPDALEQRLDLLSRWLDFPVFEAGSGKQDIGINHDKYVAEAAKDDH